MAINNNPANAQYDVVIVGAGSGGISVAQGLLNRNGSLRIALIDPATEHYYQPGWTMVGGGVFDVKATRRDMKGLIPQQTDWIQAPVAGFSPDQNSVQLANGDSVFYRQLVVSAGLKLNWGAVEGLADTLGKNGVTSNYRYDLAPYTWELVRNLRKGKAVFTQPPMPIKCAGAPQKALYLSCDAWRRAGVLKDIDVNFYNAGAVLFGVPAYVPALQSYIDKYNAHVHFGHNLVKIDGPGKRAWFKQTGDNGQTVEVNFDMIHVCPPQCAPDFVRSSPLADAAGWVDVDQFSLRHKTIANVWGIGDVTNTPNAKTMAAVRKQVPVVAQNVTDALSQREPSLGYDGYGSCPLTVERGKIVLAEFGYGGKLLPTFPQWMIKGTEPTQSAWILKKDILPPVYWHLMLKGREWLVGAQPLSTLKPPA